MTHKKAGCLSRPFYFSNDKVISSLLAETRVPNFYFLFSISYLLNDPLKHFLEVLEAKTDPRGAAMGAV